MQIEAEWLKNKAATLWASRERKMGRIEVEEEEEQEGEGVKSRER